MFCLVVMFDYVLTHL